MPDVPIVLACYTPIKNEAHDIMIERFKAFDRKTAENCDVVCLSIPQVMEDDWQRFGIISSYTDPPPPDPDMTAFEGIRDYCHYRSQNPRNYQL